MKVWEDNIDMNDVNIDLGSINRYSYKKFGDISSRSQNFKSLKILKGKIKHYNIHSFDVETYGNYNKFLLGGYYDGKRYKSFNNKHRMIEYMRMKASKDTMIFATNLGFDFNALYYGTREYDKFRKIFRNGNLITASDDDMIFSDTMNFTPSSVENMGKLLNLNKMTKPKFLGKKNITLQQAYNLRDYNSVDCKITQKFMVKFQDMINKLGGNLKLTIASTAMDLYRRKYQPYTIMRENIYYDVRKLIYEAYYGGRVEAFKRGMLKEKYFMYDFNSLYPSVMLNKYPLPSSAKHIYRKCSIDNIMKYEGISRVMIRCPAIRYPLLPYRTKDKLLFPAGIFEGSYTHIELRKAIRLGYKILWIYETLYYTKTFHPFKKWVNELYAIRLKYQHEKNDIYATIIKLCLNALYGKFGMSHIEDTKFFDLKNREYPIKELIGAVPDDKGEFAYKVKNKIADYNYVIPILAVYTTAYGRIKLYEALTKYEAIYCDTDSIISRHEIKGSEKLGELKLENKLPTMIIKPKIYTYINMKDNEEVIKAKGYRRLSKKKLLMLLKGYGLKQERFMKTKEAIKHRRLPNYKYKFKKHLRIEDDKRKWIKSFNIDELQDSEPITL